AIVRLRRTGGEATIAILALRGCLSPPPFRARAFWAGWRGRNQSSRRATRSSFSPPTAGRSTRTAGHSWPRPGWVMTGVSCKAAGNLRSIDVRGKLDPAVRVLRAKYLDLPLPRAVSDEDPSRAAAREPSCGLQELGEPMA